MKVVYGKGYKKQEYIRICKVGAYRELPTFFTVLIKGEQGIYAAIHKGIGKGN